MNYRSPLARVIGLGSAKEGSMHWWWQRLTAVALVPLSIWFVFSVAFSFTGECQVAVYVWITSPIVSTFLIAFVVSLFYHAQLGIQVVLEDYVHHEAMKLLLVLVTKFLSAVLVIFSIISILRIALT